MKTSKSNEAIIENKQLIVTWPRLWKHTMGHLSYMICLIIIRKISLKEREKDRGRDLERKGKYKF